MDPRTLGPMHQSQNQRPSSLTRGSGAVWLPEQAKHTWWLSLFPVVSYRRFRNLSEASAERVGIRGKGSMHPISNEEDFVPWTLVDPGQYSFDTLYGIAGFACLFASCRGNSSAILNGDKDACHRDYFHRSTGLIMGPRSMGRTHVWLVFDSQGQVAIRQSVAILVIALMLHVSCMQCDAGFSCHIFAC